MAQREREPEAGVVKLRDAARGMPCQVRLPSICNGDDATTVLAHVRLAGITGVGMKAPDLLGSWACSSCHDAIDRRAHTDLDRDFLRLAHYEGVMRTINELIRRGKVRT
mgnify:CR=1 FL=1